MKNLLNMPGVFSAEVAMRYIRIRVIGFGWKHQQVECEDLEELHACLLDQLTLGLDEPHNNDEASRSNDVNEEKFRG